MTETRSGTLHVQAQQGALRKRNLSKPTSIEARRIALERMITLEFPHFRAFFAEYSANISMTGMFIRTDRIQPPGTLAAFEFDLANGSSPISGKAQVAWVRERHEAPDRPAGLGLRFVEMGEENRQLIRCAVEKRMQDNGEPIEPNAPSTAPPQIHDEGREAPQAVKADLNPSPIEAEAEPRFRPDINAQIPRTMNRRWRWAIFVGLAGLFAAALLYLYQEHTSGTASADEIEPRVMRAQAEQPRVSHTQAEGTVAHTQAEGTHIDQQMPTMASPKIEDPSQEIANTMNAWADAWSTQQVDTYLSFYAEGYRPANDMSLERWRELRRDRISSPDRIEVDIADLEVRLLSAERAQASFLQSYASDRYRDNTRKIFDLVLKAGKWRIQGERLLPAT